MHAMLAPDLLCRVLTDDPRLSREAHLCLQRARVISVPAAGMTQLMAWQATGRFRGDLMELVSLLEAQGVQVVPLTNDTFRTLHAQPWHTPGQRNAGVSLTDQLVMATAITANAVLLTEHQSLAQMAPANSLWLPPSPTPEGESL